MPKSSLYIYWGNNFPNPWHSISTPKASPFMQLRKILSYDVYLMFVATLMILGTYPIILGDHAASCFLALQYLTIIFLCVHV